MRYASLDLPSLLAEKQQLTERYEALRGRGLRLDMSRGKPSPEQSALSDGLLTAIGGDFNDEAGLDTRNYGELAGIPEMRRIFGEMVGADPENVVVCGSASLNAMYDTVARAMLFGLAGSPQPWGQLPAVKFLCPAPGYDRHFAICEALGIEMIPVPMLETGPDMETVERLARNDSAVRAIWCVPRFSNPTGIVYSDGTVERLAALKARAPDFTILWDNAYCVHELTEGAPQPMNILAACERAGCPDRPLVFASFSKITFAGGSVSCVAGSAGSIAEFKRRLAAQTISFNKVNQLMHARFFRNIDGVRAHMKKHAALLKPKFQAVLDTFEQQLADSGIARWTRPLGGYFISLYVMEGTAGRTVQLCGEAGVKLTAAGAPFPYEKDPADSNIRIAPSYPSVGELLTAAEVVCISARLAAIEKLLAGVMPGK